MSILSKGRLVNLTRLTQPVVVSMANVSLISLSRSSLLGDVVFGKCLIIISDDYNSTDIFLKE